MLDQSEGAMAKRTKRVAARKVGAGSKASKKPKATKKKKAASRPVSAKPKRQKAKTGRKQSGAKKASRRPRSTAPPGPLQTETTIVDVVEQPVPGVFVVTEFVETHTSSPDITKQPDLDRTVGPGSEQR